MHQVNVQTQPTADLVTGLRALIVALLFILVSNWLGKKLFQVLKFKSKIDKLPGPPISNLLLGNIPSDVLSMFMSMSKSGQQKLAANFYTGQIQSLLGHTIIYDDNDLFRVWLGKEPVVCIWKPEMVERVLGDNFLLEKSYHYDFLKPWLGNGLLTSPGKIWRTRRKLLGPSFHFNILQTFIPIFNKKSTILAQKLNDRLNEDNNKSSIVVDITPLITACALDAICETIMGVRVNAQEKVDNDYCKSVYIVGETFLERVIQPKYWNEYIFKQTKLGKLYEYHLNKLHSFTRTVISERKQASLSKTTSELSTTIIKSNNENKKQSSSNTLLSDLEVLNSNKQQSSLKNKFGDETKLPKAFLDLLLNYKNADGKQTLSDEEIREEVDTFMFEGHDTTAMALSWTIFLLGHYPNVQQKLAEEVDDYFADKLSSFETKFENSSEELSDEPLLDEIKKLKYLDCVIKEALRLCPSVPFIGRKTTSDIKLGQYDIPAGTVLFVLIYQLHRNKQIFPNPEKFDPDRFLPHNMTGRHPFAYVPFSAGPRNCVGQKFAQAEMKMMLINLVRNFRFESVTPLDKVKVQMEMVLRPKCKLNVRVTRRA